MRIIYDANGQMCNRFWSYIDTIATALLEKQRVFIWQSVPEIKDFDNLLHSSFITFPFHKKKSITKSFLLSPICQKLYSTKLFRSLGFVNGWSTRCCSENISRVDRSVLRKIFMPSETIVKSIDDLFKEGKGENVVIVGVHIRRGDYKTFIGGRFYFDDIIYISLMRQVEKLFPEKCVQFYVATNECLSEELVRSFKVLSLKSEITAAHDLYALSKCDYIMGPPSTFSRWAAFINNVPLCFVWDRHQEILSIEDFDYLSDYSHFLHKGEIQSMTQLQNEYVGWKPVRFYKRWLSKIK